MHHCAKFHQNRSSGYGDIAIFLKIGQMFAGISQFFDFFQDDGHPPSWICLPRLWITDEAYLLVCTAVQNLVGIHAVVSII